MPTSRISIALVDQVGEEVGGRVETSERRCPIKAWDLFGRGRIDWDREQERKGGEGLVSSARLVGQEAESQTRPQMYVLNDGTP